MRRKPMTKPPPEPAYNLLDHVEKIIDEHVWMKPEQRLVTALWALHTHVYDQYTFTPRLAILSMVYGCGKTTLLVLLEHLVANPSRHNNITAAALFRIASENSATVLMDEVNHQNLRKNGDLRGVLNGNRTGSYVTRTTVKEVKQYNVFTPVAVAAAEVGGSVLPNDLAQRCLTIKMRRQPLGLPPLKRLNELSPEFIAEITKLRKAIQSWSYSCNLNPDPENPVRHRFADNWRVLLAIADSLGRGDEARATAVKLSTELPDDDPKVYLIADIKSIFDTSGLDRVSTQFLLEKLYQMDNKIAWAGWTGLYYDKPAHHLTPIELSRLLSDFGIKPHSIFQLGSRIDRGPSSKGYYRKDFEEAWVSYCQLPAHGTPESVPS